MQAAHVNQETPGLLADSEIFGAGLPLAADRHLRAAAASWHAEPVAEQHLRAAQSLAPGHAAVLIGLYRFYFYRNRLAEALGVARLCLAKAARELGLDADWRRVRPGDASFASYEAFLPRFYLFTLKGYAYLQLRLGDLAEGQAATAKLLELDPADRFGGSVLLGVLQRMGQVDDD
jgi:tetratricopeptide (TPR) repeat protein